MNVEEMIITLNKWDKAYQEGHPMVSDKEYDDLYFQLQEIEFKTQKVYPDSPTHKITYNVVNQLTKKTHNHLMLSLAKTKSLTELVSFIGSERFIAMAKLDGLTCSLHYEDGKLVSAETRGNGEIGEDITHNALVVESIPNKISYKEPLTVDGEIICKYDDFEKFSSEYRNPRNFASGSIRLLDSKECAKRNLTFVAWDVIEGAPKGHNELLSDKLRWLSNTCHFLVSPTVTVPIINDYVSYLNAKVGVKICDKEDAIDDVIQKIKEMSTENAFPIDGVVIKYDRCSYYNSLGATDHHFRGGIAFKFYDDLYATKLIDIDWTMGRTGTLTPVAVFEPVEIDGTIVERANLHNYSIMEEILGAPFKGQDLLIYKANQIIPQVYSAEGPEVGAEVEYLQVPQYCPICSTRTLILENNGVKNLICSNPDCEGKFINRLDHFCGKKGLDIKGLSTATLNKLLDWGWINKFSDVFTLKRYKDEWEEKDGFGEKSVENILSAIDGTKDVSFDKFISALGIPLIGPKVANDLMKNVSSYQDFRDKVKSKFNFSKIDGFAYSKSQSLMTYDYTDADYIVEQGYLNIQIPEEEKKDTLDGITVVITGKLNICKNRKELEDLVRAAGGKISSSVSKNTTYLINNDSESTSSKNLTAKKLGIEVITEQKFLEKFDLK